MLDQLPSERTHRLSEFAKKCKPVDVLVVTESFLEDLYLIFFEEQSIRIQRLSQPKLTC